MLRAILAICATAIGCWIILAAPAATADGTCGPGYYWSDAHQTCVESPDSSTGNATAICRDGSDSHSLSHSGTCSRHGGVAQWCPCGGAPAAASSDAPTLSASRDNEFVAIAYSPATGVGGWGSAGTQQQANQIALNYCVGLDDCQVTAWAHNACAAVAVGDFDGWYGGLGPDPASAATDAMARLGGPGRIIATHCSS